jgi:RNA polymerase sigma-70 factor (ECF subfamily)
MERPLDDGLDEALAERVRRGDAEAFDTLVSRHLRRAYGVAYRLLGQREDAEDLVQEAFLAVLERIDTFQAGRSFAPWFYRILVNRGLNAHKARAVRVTKEIPVSAAARGPSPERAAEQEELRRELRSALEGLPERQRVIVELFELEGFRSPEIAGILEISEGTVRWHLHEARRMLRRVLAPFGREG